AIDERQHEPEAMVQTKLTDFRGRDRDLRYALERPELRLENANQELAIGLARGGTLALGITGERFPSGGRSTGQLATFQKPARVGEVARHGGGDAGQGRGVSGGRRWMARNGRGAPLRRERLELVLQRLWIVGRGQRRQLVLESRSAITR